MSQWGVVAGNKNSVRSVLAQVQEVLVKTIEGGPVQIVMSRPTRTKEQNRLLWPLLRDCSSQIKYNNLKLSPEDWKDLMTVGFEGVQRSAPSLDGQGLVFFGVRTSKYPKDTFSAFIEYIYAEGTQRGVKWSKQSQDNYEEVKP